MAVVTTFLNNDLPQLSRSIQHLRKSAAVANGSAANTDNIQLFTVPAGATYRVVGGFLAQDASLGASCTIQLQRNRGGSRTNMTAATTAGAASRAGLTEPMDLQGGDILEALVGGAGITASANINLDLLVTRG
jgi:hypothetical protein